MLISQQTVSYQLKNSEKILSSDAREPTSHMRIQNQIRYDFEKDLIVENFVIDPNFQIFLI